MDFLSCQSKMITIKAKGEIPSSIKRKYREDCLPGPFGTAQRSLENEHKRIAMAAQASIQNILGFPSKNYVYCFPLINFASQNKE